MVTIIEREREREMNYWCSRIRFDGVFIYIFCDGVIIGKILIRKKKEKKKKKKKKKSIVG